MKRTATLSHCIHESLLDLVEDEDAEKHKKRHEGEAVAEGAPREVALTKCDELKGLNNGGEWVGKDEGVETGIGDHAEGIDNRGGVHPELDNESEEYGEVTIFSGHRGDENAEAKTETSEHDDHHGDDKDGNEDVDKHGGTWDNHTEMNVGTATEEVEVETDEEQQLDAESQEIAQHRGDGDNEAWEVDLTKHGLVGDEGARGLVETVGEIKPANVTGHIKQGLGHAVGTHFGNTAEDNHVHDDGENGLDDIPQRSEDGLLVLYYNVTLDKKHDKVSVSPYLSEIYAPQLILWADNHGPILIHIQNFTILQFYNLTITGMGL